MIGLRPDFGNGRGLRVTIPGPLQDRITLTGAIWAEDGRSLRGAALHHSGRCTLQGAEWGPGGGRRGQESMRPCQPGVPQPSGHRPRGWQGCVGHRLQWPSRTWAYLSASEQALGKLVPGSPAPVALLLWATILHWEQVVGTGGASLGGRELLSGHRVHVGLDMV